MSMVLSDEKLTELQWELLKSLKHVTTEKQVQEVKALLNFYFRHQLDETLNKEENHRNYTVAIYNEWLKGSKK